jgi:flagellar hook-associated protein 2
MSSSSSISTYTTSTGSTAISGLASGIDTETIIDGLITAESTKLNSLKQKAQLAEWKQEAYRSIISDITTFNSTYFSTTSSSSLTKASNYLQFTTGSSNATSITATATSTSTAGSHTISVSQLATAATLTGSSSISKGVVASDTPTYTSGQSFVITVDGAEYTVKIDSSVTDVDSLQSAIDSAVGTATSGTSTVSKVVVSTNSDGYLMFTAGDDSGVQAISIADSSSNGALSDLGFGTSSSTSNQISTSSTMATIAAQMSTAMTFNSDGEANFTINGTALYCDEDDTLSTVIERINKSGAGVTAKYDELTGKLVLTANTLGAGATITVSDTDGSFISSLLGGTVAAGTDSVMTIDGTKLTRNTNSVVVDGVTYKLGAVTTEDVTVTVEQDTEAISSLVSNFVDAYNTLIETINAALDETYDSDYPPLTSDQEAEMTETEISQWNEKAKTGLLANDTLLTKMLSTMRNSLMNSVSGSSLTLADIGITTGTYTENGKLYLDEDALAEAIEADASSIAELFGKRSTSYSSNTSSGVRTLSSSERATRTSEEGIAWRFFDTLLDYVATGVDSAGNKGFLLEKAGMDSDGSDSDNAITKQITEYETRISDEEERLETLRTRLEAQYAAMEAAISELNSQSSYIASLTSSDS